MTKSLFAISFAVLGLTFLVLMAIAHEQVHVEIYKHYGIPSHIEYFSHFPDLVTVVDQDVVTTEQCPESCQLAHNINEAITYPLIPVVCMIFLGLFLIIMILSKINNHFDKLFETTN